MTPPTAGRNQALAHLVMIASAVVFTVASLLGVVTLRRALVDVTGHYDERRLADEAIRHAEAARVELETETPDRAAMADEITGSIQGLDGILARRGTDDAGTTDRVGSLAAHVRTELLAALALTRDEPAPERREQWLSRQRQWLDQSIGFLGQFEREMDAAGARAVALQRASWVVLVIGVLATAMIVAHVWYYRIRGRE